MKESGIEMAEDNKQIKPESFLDKFQHPFVGSFISSWIICNWDIFYSLLGGLKDPFETITKIKSQYPLSDNWLHLFILPLLGMGTYVYFGPRLLNWYLLYKHKGEVKRKFDEEVANGNAPITRIEYGKLQADRMNDLRENEILRALNQYFNNKSIKIPGESEGPASNVIEQLFHFRDEKKRLEKELLDLKAKNIGFEV